MPEDPENFVTRNDQKEEELLPLPAEYAVLEDLINQIDKPVKGGEGEFDLHNIEEITPEQRAVLVRRNQHQNELPRSKLTRYRVSSCPFL